MDEECVICLDMLNNRVCCSLECGHTMHDDCLKKYVSYNDENGEHCPICQQPLVVQNTSYKLQQIVSTTCCVFVSILAMTNIVYMGMTYNAS
jgi:hypothetical protein